MRVPINRICLLGMALILCLPSFGQEAHVGNMSGDAHRGKALYERYCIFCHGRYGDGTGDSAPYLDPRPRDFTKATFKCRSTPSGSLPTDTDLYDTISRGIHDSGMPSWKPLPNQDRVDLVAYIKTFSARFREEKAPAPLPIPTETASSPDSMKRGADLYQSLNCAMCHGNEGRGNGPSASAQTDMKNRPITPFDFTTGMHFKCGDGDLGAYRDLLTGLDGTPMASFVEAMKPDEIWDVVHYIHSFSNTKTHTSDQAKAGTQQN